MRRTGKFLLGACCLMALFAVGCEKKDDHIHAWYGQVREEATCEQGGWKEYKCECGDTRKVELPALGHNMQATEGVAATCESAGLTAGEICQRCQTTTATETPATGHTEKIIEGKTPTCVADGLTEGKVCSVCDEILLAQSVMASLGHQWAKIDETADGDVYACQRCGEERLEEPATHEHAFDEIVEEVLPTCELEGTRVRRCYCGETTVDVLAAVGHQWMDTLEKMPTCTQEGATSGKQCKICDKILTPSTVIPAIGHHWDTGTAVENGVKYTCGNCGETRLEISEGHTHVFDERGTNVSPTCENEGQEVWKCACGETQTTVLPAVGHQSMTTSGKLPTCMQDGATSGEKCKVCDKILIQSTVIPAIGHQWDEGTAVENGVQYACENCGETRLEIREEHTHVFDERMEGSLPTCEGIGIETWKCACGEVQENVLPALGHKAQPLEGKDATCQETGLTEGKICSVCQKILVQQTEISLTEHTIENGRCSVCGFIVNVGLPIAELEYKDDKNGGYWVTGVKAGGTARKIVIPDEIDGKKVTGICDNAFANCYTLNSVTVGKNVAYLGSDSFDNCYNLWEVYNFSNCSMEAKNMVSNTAGGNSWIAINAEDVYTETADSKICVQDGFILYDKNGEKTLIGCMQQTAELVLPEGITQIQRNVFSECSGLTKVVLPDTLKKIGGNTFVGCGSLQKVEIGSGVTTIERMAFSGATALQEVVFKETSGWKMIKKGESDVSVSVSTLQSPTAAADKIKNNSNMEWKRS